MHIATRLTYPSSSGNDIVIRADQEVWPAHKSNALLRTIRGLSNVARRVNLEEVMVYRIGLTGPQLAWLSCWSPMLTDFVDNDDDGPVSNI